MSQISREIRDLNVSKPTDSLLTVVDPDASLANF